MFLKAVSTSDFFLILLCGLFLGSCSITRNAQSPEPDRQTNYLSNLLVEGQVPAPQSIKSLQLYRKGSPGNPPIIELESGQKLILEFDELSDISGQFRITFTHHNADWQPSNIPEEWFLGGMNELILGGGTINRFSKPQFHHYKIEFPDRQLQFKTSGNFMLHVSDFESGIILFSLPFFVFENAGEMTSYVETVFNAGPRGTPLDQPFSTFTYPDFIQFPQFDLSYVFVQNRFWGKAKSTNTFDTVVEGETRFYLPRSQAFAANFDFIGLNVQNFSQGGKIISWDPSFTPPQVILREDVLNFSAIPSRGWSSNYGMPRSGRDARYANVRFRFYDGGEFSRQTDIYLTGDFNQWLLSDRYRLNYNSESGYWETDVLMKEGSYTYKYALKTYDNEVDDLLLSDTITRNRQEYVSLVYYTDPEYRYQRLLQAQVFYSE